MEFYSEFSKNYDKIFPLNQDKLKLIDNYFKDLKDERKNIKLLDVGCGTGSYALALTEMGYQVKAIALDAEIISLAEAKMQKLKAEVEFYRLGMLHLKEKFNAQSFDGIYVIGNVLVHLKREEIKEFLELAAELLKTEGKLFIQIVNYYRILELNLDGLPTIYSRDDTVRFERDYEYDKQKNIIHFKTRLIDHFDDQILSKNDIELYPLCKSELEDHLKEVGFKVDEFYGNPHGDQYRELNSIPLIVSAQKK